MTLKEDLGFTNDYIIIFKGANYSHKNFFKYETCAKYSPLFKWYVKTEEDLPDVLPDGVEPIRLMAEDVFEHDNLLKDEEEIKEWVDHLTSISRGRFVGEIGDTIRADVVCENSIPFESKYGRSYVNIFTTNDDIIYIWITSKMFYKSTEYHIEGILKDHKEYKNELQNVLTNCEIEETIGF